MPGRVPAPGTFEIGLVMAGAVSAGAYTAGVLDFLFQALNAWEERKRAGDSNIPNHSVQIRAVSGASAGGIASALCAMIPFTGHFPITDLPAVGGGQPVNANKNLMYRAWVEEIDISRLLTLSDLPKGKPIRSLLNADAVDEVSNHAIADVRKAIADRAANPGAAPLQPSYMANPLQLYLSLANLRGVPYVINMQTEGGIVRGHRMMAHMDYAHFAVFGTKPGLDEGLPIGATSINPQRPNIGPAKDGWSTLVDAALSTSAFPLGLRSRQFKNDLSVYQARLWPRAFNDDPSTPPMTVAPDLLETDARPYTFWTCDGGLINNEPLEYARVALSGAPDEHNPRDPREANRAVLMIDPFPDDSGLGTVPDDTDASDVVNLAKALFPALKDQARFKPQELALAIHESVFSRFLIAPIRENKGPKETDIASFGLSGFAGFLDRSFRRHDYQLGRRNCQKFLRDHLVVHVENPIVADWVKRLGQAGGLDRYHGRMRNDVGQEVLDPNFVQLIPLMDSVLAPIPALPWPRLAGGADKFMAGLAPAIETRLNGVLEGIVPLLMGLLGIKSKGLFGGLAAWLAKKELRSTVLDIAKKAITDDLKNRNLG